MPNRGQRRCIIEAIAVARDSVGAIIRHAAGFEELLGNLVRTNVRDI